ncbi:MAG: hypothetical protein GEU71_04790 [Actinobacteria bacterium]|nr:hypothetical protein [Actinomycetota bacterium]
MNLRSLAAAILLALVACTSGASGGSSSSADLDAWKTDAREPYPFTTPIPDREATAIDGLYRREVSFEEVPMAAPCRRCPPYRIYPGGATLEFTEGRFHIADEESVFGSSGHYRVDGDELTLFNDLVCPALEVTYEWTVEDGVLTLDIPHDPCAFDNLRGRYLTKYAWPVAE